MLRKLVSLCSAAFALTFFAIADTAIVDGIEWTYFVSDGQASLGGCYSGSSAVPRTTNGAVIIPSSLNCYPVTSIYSRAFNGCSGLTSVTIPSSVKSIGEYAFEGCAGLMSIVVDANNPNYKSVNGLLLSKDGMILIQGVGGDVTVPVGVMKIESGAFLGCSGLKSVTLPSSVTSIGDGAFYGCSGLTMVTIPSSVTSIGGTAFWGCSGLTSITIPSSVESISGYAFYGCGGLTSVVISEGVMSIGEYTFDSCCGLTSVTIPSSVTSIGHGAFSSCSRLTSVTIPSSVTSISGYAFYSCTNLRTIYIENGDEGRVRGLLSASGFDMTCVTFEVYQPSKDDSVNPTENPVDTSVNGGFTGVSKGTYNGVVLTSDGVMCGIVQIATAKVMRNGDVKISGFVMLEDGKRQTLKPKAGTIENGWLKVTTTCGKLGELSLIIGGDGFTGVLGAMMVKSETLDENSGVLKGSLSLSYFDAKTGRVKTKKITVTGLTDGADVGGSLTIKGTSGKRFYAEIGE